MATGSTVIANAKKYVGAGGTKFWKDYGSASGISWCCMFVWDIMRISGCGNLFYSGQKTAYVPTAQIWLAANCQKVSIRNAKAGDIVIFTWGGGSRDHIGFAIKPINSSTLQTIEGNTNNSKVAIRTRYSSNIYGIYRPKYQTRYTKVYATGGVYCFGTNKTRGWKVTKGGTFVPAAYIGKKKTRRKPVNGVYASGVVYCYATHGKGASLKWNVSPEIGNPVYIPAANIRNKKLR